MPMATLELQACRVDLDERRVERADGSAHELTPREADLLHFLVTHPSRVVGREELLAEVWGYADAVVSRACDNVVRRLRTKVEADPRHPDHVITAHGEGYRFEPGNAGQLGRLIHLGDVTVDLGRHVVEHPDRPSVALTTQEVALLEMLHDAQGALVDRPQLQRRLWGRAGGRALDAAIHRLRTKLESDPANPRWLVTERGAGYRLRGLGKPTMEGLRDGLSHAAQLLARLRSDTSWSRLTPSERQALRQLAQLPDAEPPPG